MTTTAPRPARLLDKLRIATSWAVNQRYPIAPDGYGVHCVSGQHPRWERDPRAKTIDPIGAAILMEQPDCGNILRAAMMALGANEAEVSGVEDGLGEHTGNGSYLESPRSRMYIEAYAFGIWLRAELVGKVCMRGHGRFAKEVLCPLCEEDLAHRIELAREAADIGAAGREGQA